MTFARKQDNGAVKAIGAKKLDIDFGTDDFFNSFQPAAAEEKPVFSNFGGEKKSNKLKEVDSFGWGGNLGDNNNNTASTVSFNGGGNSYNN